MDRVKLFRNVVGTLLYIVGGRAGMQHEMNTAAQELKDPKGIDWQDLKRTCRYAKATEGMKSVLKKPQGSAWEPVAVDVWTDSDWATREHRHSQSSVKIEVDGCLLYSASRKQAVIATSSAEAEVYAAAAGISEATHLVHVIGEMGFETQMVLKIDAAAARGVLHR